MFFLGGAQGRVALSKYGWGKHVHLLSAWKNGRTGYPLIDANMRELLSSGFMSNRGRQIVASFLVRDLGLDWRLGAEHFESHLLDHDVCSNWGNWNYAAGVGSDPREDRYFNILKQGKDYDPEATYIRLWCPEIAMLPSQMLLNPALITSDARAKFNISTDVYPTPCVKLLHSTFKGVTGGGGGANNRGAGKGGGVGGRDRKAASDRKRGHAHGRVPGRS